MSVTERHALSENWSACLAPEGNDDFAEEFESNCGFLLGGVLWVAREAFGFDVMDKLVYPLCGDWAILAVTSRAWVSLQGGCADISGNFDGMNQLPESVWAADGTDSAPTQFRARMGEVSKSFMSYSESALLISQLVDSLIEVGKAAADGIALCISLISETLERIIIEASIPVIGWVAGAVEAGVFVTRFWQKVNRALELIEKIMKTIERVVVTLNKIIRVLKILKTVLSTFSGAIAISNTAQTPDAVNHGFGNTA